MDNLKLAELLYPNTKTVDFWENKYTDRNLKPGQEVTRFAPSPTGYLHIGNFMGALIDYRIAKATDGVFFFRLEDTDKKREIENADKIALSMLEAFGVVPDEGYGLNGEKGEYGPYKQSERLEIYKSYAKKLVEEGKAFPCFCKKASGIEEIKNRRNEEIENTQEIEEKDECRELSFNEIKEKIENGESFALRFKSNGKIGDRIKFKDAIRGERDFQANCKDFVIMKSNGIPPYAFAHAIDDHLMRTTLVVRGEEWLSTLPQHLELFRALGFKQVKYAHTPLISKLGKNGNKRKLSKRKDPEADMRYFIEQGYPIQTVYEYVLNLANSNFEIWRKQNKQVNNMEFPFSVKKIGTSSPLFDIDKLNNISKDIIAVMSKNEVYEYVLEWSKKYNLDFAKYLMDNKEYCLNVFNIDREKKKTRKDIYKWSMVKDNFNYMFDEIKQYELDELNKEKVRIVLNNYLEILNNNIQKEEWFDSVKDLSKKLNYAVDNKLCKANPDEYNGRVSDVCMFIRIALTGLKNAPDLFEIQQILGEEKSKKRIKNLIKNL